jgi:hypothetical protein
MLVIFVHVIAVRKDGSTGARFKLETRTSPDDLIASIVLTTTTKPSDLCNEGLDKSTKVSRN